MELRAFRGVFGAICMLAWGSTATAQGVLELPSEAGESGIGLIAGWHCTAKTLEVQIDPIRAYAQGQSGMCEQRQWIAMHGAHEPR